MTDDLKNLLMNLPEGIIIVDEMSQKAVFDNLQFRKLFKITCI